MRQDLRPYQLAAIEKVRDLVSAGKRRILIVAPTGSGKTSIASEIIHSAVDKGSRAVFIAHRRELISQCSARLDEWDVDHGVIMADHWRKRQHTLVRVASVQTLWPRLKAGKMAPWWRLMVVDEAHRSCSKSYLEIIQSNQGAVTLGLTATPCRQDGKGLGDIYEEMVLVAQPRDLIPEFLMEPEVYASRHEISTEGVGSRGGDFVESELAAVADKPRLVGDVVDNWTRIMPRGKRTVVFACSVGHSKHLVERFRGAGVRAEHVDGTTPAKERDAAIGQLKAGDIEVLVNCQILTEGWDLPLLDAAVLARPTKSVGLYLQMVGRVMRPAASKTRAVVIDHGGTVRRLGWPTANREWSLDEGLRRQSSDRLPPVRQCPNCARVCVPGAAKCPECGQAFRPEPREIETEDGELHKLGESEVSAPVPPWQQQRELIKLYFIARKLGFKQNWAHHKFHRKYLRFPTGDEAAIAANRVSRSRSQ